MDPLDSDMTELSDDQPTLEFEDGSFTLTELLQSHLLPLVVQFDTARQPFTLSEFNFDLSQPLLLYKKRNIQKVATRSLCINEDRYEEVGESLLIPEDYKGWFAVLQRATGNAKPDDSVSYFKTVEELANSNTSRFLIGGTKKINGLKIIESTAEQLHHEQCPFQPGDILTREKIYHGETRKKTRLFRKPKYVTEKFLKCRDDAGNEVLFPFEQQGIFYQVSHVDGKENRNVVQMSDIVARKLLPRIIKLVFGRFPIVPCSFTGLMKADYSKIEMSVIASTMINKKNVLLEIPASCDIYFKIALTNDDLRRNTCYRNAMSLCADRAITYMRNIKVCFNLSESEADTAEDATDSFVVSKPCDIDMSMSNQYLRCDYVNVQSEPSGNVSQRDTHGVPYCRSHLSGSLCNSSNISLKSGRISTFTCQSENITTDVQIRPARRISTGRMSFCLGNSYLTVPMYEPENTMKRDSGNNNSTSRISFSSKRNKHTSFNDAFFEERVNDSAKSKMRAEDLPTDNDMPKDSDTSLSSLNPCPLSTMTSSRRDNAQDFDPTSASPGNRSFSPPPEIPPPPVPLLANQNTGVSLNVNQEHDSKHNISKSSAYAVPHFDTKDDKTANTTLSVCASDMVSNISGQLRRPSTFTFSDGCLQTKPTLRSPSFETMPDIDECNPDDHDPIYENITNLIEIAATVKSEFMTDDPCKGLGQIENDPEEPSTTERFNSDTTDLEPIGLPVKEMPEEIQYRIDPTERKDEESSIAKQNVSSHKRQGCCMHSNLEVNISGTGQPSENGSDIHGNITDMDKDNAVFPIAYPVSQENCNRQGSRKAHGSNRAIPLPENEELKSFSIDKISIKLKEIGIKDCSIEKLRATGVDGAALAAVLENETSVQDCLQGVNLVDQQKISMFIRGWRPNEQ